MLLENFLKGLAYIFPAYVANATPVVAVRILGRSHPLDGRISLPDGKRLLGEGKTIEGLLAGIGVGTVTGLVMQALLPFIFRSSLEVFTLSAGALVGDISGAFIKRRLGLPPGHPAPPLDQLGFLVAGLLLTHASHGLPPWLDLTTIILLIAFTFGMHVGTNLFAYAVGLKDRWY
ncbi:MAG: CDP-2,3-bis-(O-geranylgeranyl)-sn-glycerol synthase [Nitrososphaerota archaeon]